MQPNNELVKARDVNCGVISDPRSFLYLSFLMSFPRPPIYWVTLPGKPCLAPRNLLRVTGYKPPEEGRGTFTWCARVVVKKSALGRLIQKFNFNCQFSTSAIFTFFVMDSCTMLLAL